MRATLLFSAVLGLAVTPGCGDSTDETDDVSSDDISPLDVGPEDTSRADVGRLDRDDVPSDTEEGDGPAGDGDGLVGDGDVVEGFDMKTGEAGGDGEEPLAPGEIDYDPPKTAGDDCLDPGALAPPPSGNLTPDVPVEGDLDHFMWAVALQEPTPGSIFRFTVTAEATQPGVMVWSVEAFCGPFLLAPLQDSGTADAFEYEAAWNTVVAVVGLVEPTDAYSLVVTVVPPPVTPSAPE